MSRKFLALLFVVTLLLAAVLNGGCGGGGGGGSDNPSSENTPVESEEGEENEEYGRGLAEDEGEITTEDFYQITLDNVVALAGIKYSAGDNPNYVTQNLKFSDSIEYEDENFSITWTSNNTSVISDSGEVTRPSGTDTAVTLTALVQSGDVTASSDFEVIVIKQRTLTVDAAKSSIVSIDVDEILDLNSGESDDFQITYSDSGEQIRAIEGQFSILSVDNADDALDSVQSIRDPLGISDPYEELELINVAEDDPETIVSAADEDSAGGTGAQYSFRQVYKVGGAKVPVEGRHLTVSANSDNTTDYLSSSFLASEILDSADLTTPTMSKESAANAALSNYPGSTTLEADTDGISTIIYSLGDYESHPVMAYKVRVYGTYADENIDDTVIINTDTGEIITSYANTCTLTRTVNRTEIDELGDSVTFPVRAVYLPSFTGLKITYKIFAYSMRDAETPEVIVYSGDFDSPVTKVVDASWNDLRSHISAYMNMRDILAWWKNTFGQKSVDNKNKNIRLVINAGYSDNASSSYNPRSNESVECIQVGRLSNTLIYDHTRAIGRDTLTHETGHAVLNYKTGGLIYKNATGAIHDGYADIFGCLRDQDWKHGWRADPSGETSGITYFIDKTKCLRDATEDVTIASLSTGSLSGITNAEELYELYNSGTTKDNDGNGCHTYCRLVTHAAYLMHQDGASKIGRSGYGLTWYQLGRVWYKSMSMGLDDTSDFHTVRRNVIRAARQCGISELRIITIKKAFDAVGISEPRGVLRGYVYTESGSRFYNAEINIYNASSGYREGSTTTDRNGYYKISADTGVYIVNFSSSGYKTFSARQYVPADEAANLNVTMVGTGTGTLNVKINNSSGRPLSNVTIYLLQDWNNISRNSSAVSGTTDSAGSYSFTNIAAGHYTLLAKRTSGSPQYPEHRFNVTIGRGTWSFTGNLFEEVKDQYVALLSYNEGYDNLIPNLESRVWSYSTYLLNDGNTKSTLENGRVFAEYHEFEGLDGKGVNFVNFYKSRYAYYIDWGEDTTPDWDSSGARVYLYYGGKYIGSCTPPDDAESKRYWHVFNLKNSIRTTVNKILDTPPSAK